jgi:lysophospholipase L1-like esterase
MLIPDHSTLLFIGDSITDAGRDETGEPTPWEPQLGLGSGYVNLVNAALQESAPSAGIRVINRGISGNTVLDLAARWENDVINFNPDWLSVMIGINDVWRQFDTPLRNEVHVIPGVYEKTFDQLLTRTRPLLKGLVLMTPYMVEPNKSDPMRARMDEYGVIVRGLARKHDAILVDTQAGFDRVTEHIHPMTIAWDRIHPGTTGHMVLARSFLRAVGFNAE